MFCRCGVRNVSRPRKADIGLGIGLYSYCAAGVSRAGSYGVEWWDIREGAIVRRDTVIADQAQLFMHIPRFFRDLGL